MDKEYDVTIIGAGPAGLCAAINGASEGFKIALIDSGPEPGGKALKSSLIENYPGFPLGISGSDLIGKFLNQATKFKTDLICPQVASSLRADGDRRIITTDDGDLIVSKVVILSAGLSYRRLNAEGIPQFLGRGVLYGAPTYAPHSMGECTICIVGGANSAGQAAMYLSQNSGAKVKMLIRKNIGEQMSQYLVDRIRKTSNIEIIEATGNKKLEQVAEDELEFNLNSLVGGFLMMDMMRGSPIFED